MILAQISCPQCGSLHVTAKSQRRVQAERQIDDLLRIRPLVLATESGPELGKFNLAYIDALVEVERHD